MSVRTKRLAIGSSGTGAAVSVYTVPVGYRTIVKVIDALNEAATFGRLVLDVRNGGSSLGIIGLALGAHGTVDESKYAPVWLVMHEGDSAYMSSSVNTIDWVLNGAELAL